MTFIISTQPSNHRKMYYLHTGVERTCGARDTNPMRGARVLIALEMMALTGGKERTEQGLLPCYAAQD